MENDVISDFLKLSVPKNDVFSDQAGHGSQRKLLKTEFDKAGENKANLDARADSSRTELRQALNEELLGSVAFNVRLSIRKIRLEHKIRLDAKLKKLSVRQDRPFKGTKFQDFKFHPNTRRH